MLPVAKYQVCKFVGTTGGSTYPCANIGSNRYAPVEVTGTFVDDAAFATINAASVPIATADVAGFWGLAFTTVLTFWLVSYLSGQVVKAIKGRH